MLLCFLVQVEIQIETYEKNDRVIPKTRTLRVAKERREGERKGERKEEEESSRKCFYSGGHKLAS